jgi:2-oxoglutarate decarboxylase
VAESSQSSPVEASAFGANEWLVDEMFERYQKDPNSVDKAWWEFFKN